MNSGYRWLVIILITVAGTPSFGQSMATVEDAAASKNHVAKRSNFLVTKTDAANIKLRAEMVVKRFQDLLNVLSTGLDLEPGEIETVLYDSYTDPGARVFFDSSVMIEDDLRNTQIDGQAKDKTASQYLRDFDLLYRKTVNASVSFSNIQTSNVKRGEYLYIKVVYDCLFGNKSRISDNPYPVRKRTAELKVEKSNNKWVAWIINLRSSTEQDVSGSENDVTLVADAADGGKAFTNSGSERQKAGAKDASMTGVALLNHYMKEALFAESLRKYDEAIKNYRLALNTGMGETGRLTAKIQELSIRFDLLSRLEAKYMMGQYVDAIAEYDKAIRKDPSNSDYYFGRGKCYDRIDDLEQAARNYNKAIQYDPYNIQAYTMRGGLYEKQHAYAEALADYNVCAKMDNRNITMFHKIASLNMAVGNTNAAIEALNKAISINDKIALLYQLKGELQYKSARMAEAYESFGKAVILDSTRAVLHFYRGLCRVGLGQPERAADHFATARSLHLDGVNAGRIREIGAEYYKAAMALSASGNTQAASDKLNVAIILDPAADSYRFQRGDWLFHSGDFNGAIADYSSVILSSPVNYEAYCKRAMARCKQFRYEEAISDLLAAQAIRPRDGGIYKYLGDAYYSLKDYAQATINYDAALASYSASNKSLSNDVLLDLYIKKGEASYHAGNFFAAIEHFSSAAKLNRNVEVVYLNRGSAYLRLNELGKAEEDFRRLIEMNEKSPKPYFELGKVSESRKAYENAISMYNTAIRLDSGRSLSFDPLYYRATCLAKMGKYAEALKDYLAIEESGGQDSYKSFNVEVGKLFINFRNPDRALIYLDKAIAKDSLDISGTYLKSVAHALKGQPDEAFRWLEKTLAIPKNQVRKTAIDNDFGHLKQDVRLTALITRYHVL